MSHGRHSRGQRAWKHELMNGGGAESDATGSSPDRADLLLLDYSLDAEPWVGVTARTNIDTLTLGYSLDGEPFIGVSE